MKKHSQNTNQIEGYIDDDLVDLQQIGRGLQSFNLPDIQIKDPNQKNKILQNATFEEFIEFLQQLTRLKKYKGILKQITLNEFVNLESQEVAGFFAAKIFNKCFDKKTNKIVNCKKRDKTGQLRRLSLSEIMNSKKGNLGKYKNILMQIQYLHSRMSLIIKQLSNRVDAIKGILGLSSNQPITLFNLGQMLLNPYSILSNILKIRPTNRMDGWFNKYLNKYQR